MHPTATRQHLFRAVALAALLPAALAACAGDPPASRGPSGAPARPAPADGPGLSDTRAAPDPFVLGYFEGRVNPATGEFSIRSISRDESGEAPDDPLRMRTQGLCDEDDYVVVQDGTPGSGPPDSIEVATIGASLAQDGSCYGLWNPLFDPPLFCADVTVRSFYTATRLEEVYAEILTMSDTNHLGWPTLMAAEPDPGNPPTDAWGLWYYGDIETVGLAPANAGTETWVFERNNDTFYSFTGRIVGAATELCDGVDNDCDGAVDEGGVCGAVCGNSSVEGGEECDDGNTNSFDGCSATCSSEPTCPPGWYGWAVGDGGNGSCYAPTSLSYDLWQAARHEARSVNALLVRIESPAEQAFLEGLFLSAESFWLGCEDTWEADTFRWEGSTPVLWDNFHPSEPTPGGDDRYCLWSGLDGGTWGDTINGASPYRGIMELSLCGNAVVDVSAGETCDDGDLTPGDGCSPSCQADACGDGWLHCGTEECDDGNVADGDGCSSACLDEGGREYFWIGTGTGAWNDCDAWSPSGVPDSLDTASFGKGSDADVTIPETTGGLVQLNTMLFYSNYGGNAYLDGVVEVTNNLDLEGGTVTGLAGSSLMVGGLWLDSGAFNAPPYTTVHGWFEVAPGATFASSGGTVKLKLEGGETPQYDLPGTTFDEVVLAVGAGGGTGLFTSQPGLIGVLTVDNDGAGSTGEFRPPAHMDLNVHDFVALEIGGASTIELQDFTVRVAGNLDVRSVDLVMSATDVNVVAGDPSHSVRFEPTPAFAGTLEIQEPSLATWEIDIWPAGTLRVGGSLDMGPFDTMVGALEISPGGLFDGGGGEMDCGSVVIDGGTLVSTSFMIVTDSITMYNGGTFVHNGGQVEMPLVGSPTAILDMTPTTFNDLSFGPAGTTVEFGANSSFNVTGDFAASGASGNEINLVMHGGVSGVDQWGLDLSSATSVTMDYVYTEDSAGTIPSGEAPLHWYDGGGNSGWGKKIFVADGCVRWGSGGGYGCGFGAGIWLNGVGAANSECQSRAVAGGLSNPSGYRVLLSTGTQDAFCLIQGLSGTRGGNCGQGALPQGGGPWYNTAGELIGRTVYDLFMGNCDTTDQGNGNAWPACLTYSPYYDELGVGQATFQWTGSNPNGTGTGYYCGSWDGLSSLGTTGKTGYLDRNWFEIWVGGSCTSNSDVSIYCFEQ